MKAGWQTKALADTCEVFADGDWIESKDQSSDGIRLIQTGNVGEGEFKDRGEKARYISEATFKRLRCTEIFEGDCLISRLPDPAGRSCMLPNTRERMITAVDCTIVRFNVREIVPTFFNYFSQSVDYLSAVDSDTTGTTRKRISRSKLGQIPLPVPPLAEQQRIVDILDDAFDGIATAKVNAERNLQNTRALFERHLQSTFAKSDALGPLTALGALSEKITDGTHNSPAYVLEGVAMLDSKHVRLGFTIDDSEPEKFISRETDDTLAKRCKPRAGDILISSRGSIGKIAIVRDGQDFNIMGNMILLRLPSNISRRFIAFYLLSQVAHIESIARGVAQKGLYLSQVREYLIPLPPEQLQAIIANELSLLFEETQRLESLYQRKLTALDELKKSLLHQAFSGAL